MKMKRAELFAKGMCKTKTTNLQLYFNMCSTTVVREVDGQSRGCRFTSQSLLYKCYSWIRQFLATSEMAQG